MTEELVAELDRHKDELNKIQVQLPSPEMITDYDRGECYLRGNPAAFVALATEMLGAAKGKSSNLAHLYWLRSESWNFDGFIVEPTITPYTKNRARFKWRWTKQNVLRVITAVVLVICLLIGFYTSVRWLLHLFFPAIR